MCVTFGGVFWWRQASGAAGVHMLKAGIDQTKVSVNELREGKERSWDPTILRIRILHW